MFLTPRFAPRTIEELKSASNSRDPADLARREEALRQQVGAQHTNHVRTADAHMPCTMPTAQSGDLYKYGTGLLRTCAAAGAPFELLLAASGAAGGIELLLAESAASRCAVRGDTGAQPAFAADRHPA